ncbi:hypothetical protein [Pelagibius sp. Alg239-R121]|nr:hypothetical protein [Pelagibius sp. Alg239-R121]
MNKTDHQDLGKLAGSAEHEKWPALRSTAFILLTSVVIWLAFVMAVANLG